MKTVLITGCSSGIGLCCAEGLKARGYRVLATARKEEDLKMLDGKGLEAIALDYAIPQSVEACATEVARRTGGKLFALFNNGAYGQPGALEDISRQIMEDQFAANFFGWHHLTVLMLPLIRAHGEGRIVNCSSVLGITAFRFRGPYNSTKFAIEGWSDTLRRELKSSGIKVVTINPGPIESRFVANAKAAFEKNIDMSHSHFKEDFQRQRERLERGGNSRFKLPATAVLAKLILALERPNPKGHYYVTTPTYLMAAARRLLPEWALDQFISRYND